MKIIHSIETATHLIAEQFPAWSHLQIARVEKNGWDNTMFRLGSDMVVRLPNGKEYAEQVTKEHKWLPRLAPHLSFAIPEPLYMGKPTEEFPMEWSIYKWIDGKSANLLPEDKMDLVGLALDVAQFLKELHKISAADGPPAGTHNHYRGAHPSVYSGEVANAIEKLHGVVDTSAAMEVWNTAIGSRFTGAPLWVHGDLSSANILVKNRRLSAVIDFGCAGIGDPACDLVIAWTFFHGQSRSVFKDEVAMDRKMWQRARGWALWKALVALVEAEDKDADDIEDQKRIIAELIEGHTRELSYPKFWVGVSCKEHVKIGVKHGFCQFCHGKHGPVRRLKHGDYVIYYSPKVALKGNKLYQQFTAIGRVIGKEAYQAVEEEIRPFRMAVEYFQAKHAPIRRLIPKLQFIKDKENWGKAFRYGFLEIDHLSFDVISHAMLGFNPLGGGDDPENDCE